MGYTIFRHWHIFSMLAFFFCLFLAMYINMSYTILWADAFAGDTIYHRTKWGMASGSQTVRKAKGNNISLLPVTMSYISHDYLHLHSPFTFLVIKNQGFSPSGWFYPHIPMISPWYDASRPCCTKSSTRWDPWHPSASAATVSPESPGARAWKNTWRMDVFIHIHHIQYT